MPDIKKILVIRLSSFGDIVLSFQLLKNLRENFPAAQIDFLTKEKYRDLVALSPDIKRIFYGDSLSLSRKEIKNENYDLIIDIHKNPRSFFLSVSNAKRVVRYKKENIKKFFLVNFKWNLFKSVIPVWKKYILAAAKYLPEKKFTFSPVNLNFNNENKLNYRYIVIAPSARHFTKTYPVEKFIDAIKRYYGSEENSGREMNSRIVLVGDDTEKDLKICKEIERQFEDIVNLGGKLDISELANVLHHSDYVICNDSAILHLSEALNKKVIAIFGSTVREFGFYPQLDFSEVKEIVNLHCRPCTHFGRDKCPLGHFKCMREIEFTIS